MTWHLKLMSHIFNRPNWVKSRHSLHMVALTTSTACLLQKSSQKYTQMTFFQHVYSSPMAKLHKSTSKQFCHRRFHCAACQGENSSWLHRGSWCYLKPSNWIFTNIDGRQLFAIFCSFSFFWFSKVSSRLFVCNLQAHRCHPQARSHESANPQNGWPWQPQAEEEIRNGGAKGHNGAVILHFSGCGVKPWDLIFSRFLTNLAGEPGKVWVNTLSR